MSVIVLLIVAGALVAGGFLLAFVWAVRSGQFDDTCTPAIRVLLDESPDSRLPAVPPARDDKRGAAAVLRDSVPGATAAQAATVRATGL